MKPTTSNRISNIITIIAFIIIYAGILVIFCRPIIGIPIFYGGISLGFLSTFNEKNPEIIHKDDRITKSSALI